MEVIWGVPGWVPIEEMKAQTVAEVRNLGQGQQAQSALKEFSEEGLGLSVMETSSGYDSRYPQPLV